MKLVIPMIRSKNKTMAKYKLRNDYEQIMGVSSIKKDETQDKIKKAMNMLTRQTVFGRIMREQKYQKQQSE